MGTLKHRTRADKVAQWAKVPTAKSDGLSLTSGKYMVEGENPLLKVVSDPHTLTLIHNKQTNIMLKSIPRPGSGGTCL